MASSSPPILVTFLLFWLGPWSLQGWVRAQGTCTIPADGSLLLAPGISCQLGAGRYDLDKLIVNGTLILVSDPVSGDAPILSVNRLFVGAEGKVTADGAGYPAQTGPGAPTSASCAGSHGGSGGCLPGSGLQSDIGPAYGFAYAPTQAGSGGGGAEGGDGGGVIFINVTTTAVIEGFVSANGAPPGGAGSSAGSGGSVYIIADRIYGGGSISAVGGAGTATGGAGGGGRIALDYRLSLFHPPGNKLIHAYGGQSGTSSAAISIQSFQSSSAYSGYPAHPYGRLQTSVNRVWRAARTDTSQYLIATLATGYFITAIETRGDRDSTYRVTAYKLECLNPITAKWEIVGRSVDKFSGNRDGSTVVRQYLQYPVLCQRVKVIPLTWYGAISLAISIHGYTPVAAVTTRAIQECDAEVDGAGGPGTVLFGERTAGVATISVDNRGQRSGLPIRCGNVTGFGAWILDSTSQDVDQIKLSHGAHLVIAVPTTIANMEGDESSVMHVQSSAPLTISREMHAQVVVNEGASLVLAHSAEAVITDWLLIRGELTFINPLLQWTLQNEVIMRAQQVFASKLLIEGSGSLTIENNAGLLNLSVSELIIWGSLTAGQLNAQNWNKIFTGPSSVVEFMPYDREGFYLGSDIEIQGKMMLGQAVNIQRPCNRFILDGGSLVWNDKSVSTFTCCNVTINGKFTPVGGLNFGEGLCYLIVGSAGYFQFTVDGPVLADSVAVSGRMLIENYAEFKSSNRTDERVQYFVIHGPGGELTLSNQLESSNGTLSYSILRAETLVVNGLLDANILHVGNEGYDTLRIGTTGNLTFTPASDFIAHEVLVDGIFTSLEPLVFSAGSVFSAGHELHVGVTGTVTLDSKVQNSKSWSGESVLGFYNVYINGRLLSGFTSVHQGSTGGMNFLSIGSAGIFKFESTGEFLCKDIEIAGLFEAYNSLNITAPPSFPDSLTIAVVNGGTAILESESTHPHGPWIGISTITGKEVFIEHGGVMKAGDAQLILTKLTVRGSLYLDPSLPTQVTDIIVPNLGLMDVAFKRAPINATLGNRIAQIMARTINLGGTLQGRCLNITVGEIEVKAMGVLDVTGSGYLSGIGPGAGAGSATGGSGASHGGRGGRGGTTSAYTLANNLPYGSIFEPGSWGSGGGAGDGGEAGGRGGGILHLYITHRLLLDGVIKANGLGAQTRDAGGGSGGSIHADCYYFEGGGSIECNGGPGSVAGGGGAGGRVTVKYHTGNFQSGHVIAKGGSGAESGGPGVTYLEGINDNVRNLRVDNKCQQPQVIEPSGAHASATDFATYMQTGAVAYLLPPLADFEYDFTLVEIYGGAHLVTHGERTQIRSIAVVGDDTGHLHIPPSHSLVLTEVSPWKRVNVTYHIFLYESSTWVLPQATVEFRQPLDEKARGMSSTACSAPLLRSPVVELWGRVDASRAHLLIARG